MYDTRFILSGVISLGGYRTIVQENGNHSIEFILRQQSESEEYF